MAHPLAVRRRFLLCVGAAARLFPAGWPRWIQEWLRVLFGYRQYSTPPLASHLLGHQIGSRLGPILIAALLVCALAVAWRMRHSSAAQWNSH